jgi:hypothetical protein
LQGQFLEVLGWTHRHGTLHLNLVLPDGSRSLIPAVWTDLNEGCHKSFILPNTKSTSAAIGATQDLLHARKIVDALLCKLDSSEQEFKKASKEENKRAQATGTLADITGAVSAKEDLANTRLRTTKTSHNRSGQPDQQDGLFKQHQTDSGGKP